MGSSPRLLVIAEGHSHFWRGSLEMTAAKAIAFCMREGVETHWGRVAGLQQWGRHHWCNQNMPQPILGALTSRDLKNDRRNS